MPHIYKISNLVNGKLYIGQTTNIKTRWTSHLSLLRMDKHRNLHLQAAFKKYGEQAFVFAVIEECENANEREVYWIGYFGGTNGGLLYNKSSGGKSGGKMSQESRNRISAWQRGRTLTPEHAANIGRGNRGKKCTDEHKRRMSVMYKGRPIDEETKRKISESKMGRIMPPEERERRKGLGSKSVVQLSMDCTLIRKWASAKEAGEVLGLWKSDITQCCRGNRKTVSGFIFQYEAIFDAEAAI